MTGWLAWKGNLFPTLSYTILQFVYLSSSLQELKWNLPPQILTHPYTLQICQEAALGELYVFIFQYFHFAFRYLKSKAIHSLHLCSTTCSLHLTSYILLCTQMVCTLLKSYFTQYGNQWIDKLWIVQSMDGRVVWNNSLGIVSGCLTSAWI